MGGPTEAIGNVFFTEGDLRNPKNAFKDFLFRLFFFPTAFFGSFTKTF